MTTNQAPPVDPPWHLVVLCVECGDGIELALPIDRNFEQKLVGHGWFASIMEPPQAGKPIVLGTLCNACAKARFPPDIFQAAEARRQRFVQETK